MRKRFEAPSIRVALPNHVQMAHGKRDRLPIVNALRDVEQHSVAELRCIGQANEGHYRAIRAANMFKCPLATKATHRIFADWIRGIFFARASARHWRKAINVSRRERHDAALSVLLANQARKEAVHCPSEGFVAGGAKLHP